jgi:hypothetical protein
LQRSLEIALGIDKECRRGDEFFSLADAVENLDIAVSPAAELDPGGSKRPSPLATRTIWRVPLSIMALAGTAIAGCSSAPA